MDIPSIKDLNVKKKRIFLRADLNIKTKDIQLDNCFKAQKIVPTLEYLLDQEAKIVLATHIGRPIAKDDKNYYDENLSTQKIIALLKNYNFKVNYQPDLYKASIEINCLKEKEVLLLENLRFFNGEQGTILERNTFAKILKSMADIYINDAFALIHRDDTSVLQLPQLFKKKDRGIGLLMKEETETLEKITTNIQRPLTIIMGGGKAETKLMLIEKLIKNLKPDYILTGGTIGNAFFQEKNAINQKFLNVIEDIKEEAKKNNTVILYPLDMVICEQNNYMTINTENLAKETAVDIGPKTINAYKEIIQKSKTTIFNGPMGIYENPESRNGTIEVLSRITETDHQTSIAGGGDTIKAIIKFRLEKKFSYLSTGGGGMIAFLAAESLFKLSAYNSLKNV